MDYADKVVAITGGTQGIGLAMARAFHQRGARIAIADRQGAEAAAEPFSGLGMTVDVGIEDEVAGFVRETGVRLGPVDVYVSNAGVLMTDEPTWDAAGTDDGQWQTAFDINLMGSVRGARHAWPVMRERGGGVFVIVASAAGLLAQIGAAPYTATKHAVTGLTRSASLDGRKYDIACGQIDIGNAATEMTTRMKKGIIQANGTTAVEPTMDVDNVANAVVHMASLPLDANVLFMTVMATQMPYIGRG